MGGQRMGDEQHPAPDAHRRGRLGYLQLVFCQHRPCPLRRTRRRARIIPP
jgi:hypothetical protein